MSSLDLKKTGTFALVSVVLTAGILLPVLYFSNKAYLEGEGVETEELVKEKKEEFIDPFKDVAVNAESVFVWDIENQKEIYSVNPDKVLPLASVTKIMTAITAIEVLPDFTVIDIERDFIMAEGNSGLFVDERWRLKDLLDFSLLVSSNDGVRAIASVAGAFGGGENIEESNRHELARNVFVSKMNEKARSLGLVNTRFYNESGLDVDDFNSGSYGTAREAAKMFEYALRNHPEILEPTRSREITFSSLNNIYHSATNTNIVIDDVPGMIASKTGFTDLAGGNLVVIFDPSVGRPVIISVLGSTREDRFEDVLTLANKTLDYINQGR